MRVIRYMSVIFPLSLVAAAIGAITLLSLPSIAHAQEYTVLNGSFTHDDDVQSSIFTTQTTQTFTFYTTSYAGGPNADGSYSYEGGFDPILTLFGASGSTINYNDDDPTGFANTDPTTGLTADSYFTQTLGPGTYTLSISEYDNVATTNSSSWSEAGNPNFTSQFSNPFNPMPGPFLDQTGDPRTSAFTYNIASNGAYTLGAPVPELPETVDFAIFTAFGICFLLRTRKTHSQQ